MKTSNYGTISCSGAKECMEILEIMAYEFIAVGGEGELWWYRGHAKIQKQHLSSSRGRSWQLVFIWPLCAATTILPLTEKRYYKRCSLAFSHFFYFPIFTSTLQKAMASACFLSSYYMDCNLLIRNSFVYYYCKADTQSFLFLLANL